MIWHIFGRYLRPYRGRLFLAYSALGAAVLTTLLKPWPLKLIFDHILLDKPLPPQLAFAASLSDRSLAAVLCLAMVGIVALGSLASYVHRYLLAAVGQGVTNDVRLSLFDQLQSLSLSYHGSSRTGDLVLRLTSDINAVRDLLVTDVQKWVKHLSTFVGTLAVMLWMDWRLTIPVLAVVPIIYVVSSRFSSRMHISSRKRRQKESEVASLVQETMISVPAVQAFTQEKQEKERFAGVSQESLEVGLEGMDDFLLVGRQANLHGRASSLRSMRSKRSRRASKCACSTAVGVLVLISSLRL